MKVVRCYNRSYMEGHNIDWFFQFHGLPCYSLSNGFILPDIIKVSSNRTIQDLLYRDIRVECRSYMALFGENQSYKQIQYELFNNSDSLRDLNGVRQVTGQSDDRQSYLSINDVYIIRHSIEYVLSRDFMIDIPSDRQVNSLIQVYAGFFRRGFICFYPLPDDNEGFLLIPIGVPKSISPDSMSMKTFAAKLCPYLPAYNARIDVRSLPWDDILPNWSAENR